MTTSEIWTPLLQTERANIYVTRPYMAEALLNYKIKNLTYLKAFEPEREPNYHELQETINRVNIMQQDMCDKKSLALVATLKDQQQIIASINFTNFIYGAFQACSLGYSIDQELEGQGIMYEIVKASIDHVRDHFQIHRIMATHLVNNHRSANLLKRLGFEKEGLARAYVKIEGEWRDNILNSLIFDQHG